MNFVEILKEVKKLYPTIKVTSGLSNISFGMPLRKVVNQHFLTLATYVGMDSAILDPCNRDMVTTLLVPMHYWGAVATAGTIQMLTVKTRLDRLKLT